MNWLMLIHLGSPMALSFSKEGIALAFRTWEIIVVCMQAWMVIEEDIYSSVRNNTKSSKIFSGFNFYIKILET